MSVQSLLRDLQRGKSHMAIVTDEFGGVCGIVTIEDALEEIVGEITDEHDETLTDGILVHSKNTCETLANVPIDDLNQRMHFSLPEEADYDTIGGFAFHTFGRIPSEGETIVADGVSLEVLSSSRRRTIDSVLQDYPKHLIDHECRKGSGSSPAGPTIWRNKCDHYLTDSRSR